MGANNEGRCCDAVLRVLEDRHQALRTDVQRDTAATRGVEVVCRVGDQRYALEHTLIEPFSENQKDNIRFQRVFDDRFEAEVRGSLRSDLAYTIDVDVYAFEGMSVRELANVRQALLDWIRGSVSRPPEPTRFPQTAIHAERPEVPVPLRLACHRSQRLGGRLLPGRFAPPNLEDLRRTRLLKVLQDKSPKLRAAKVSGTRTVLVLENNDIALTNESVASETINELAKKVPHVPDDIYVVDASVHGHFYVTQVRRQGRMCLDTGPDFRRWEFKAEDLVEI